MKLNIPFSLEGQQDITNLKDINDSFASGTLKIMYLGTNRNRSSFTKEAVMRALPTLYNVPIVANYDREADTIGGHDMDLVLKGDTWDLVNLTQPCGVIPEHARFHFDLVLDSSGVCHEYLVADDVILWKRQEVYDVLMSKYDGKISHSMEINAVNTSYDAANEIINIDDFQFTALCLLGENDEPCFEGSDLKINRQQMFSESMNEMLAELKETLAELNKQVPSEEDVTDTDVKGGEDMDEEVKVEDEVVETVEEVVEETEAFEEETQEAEEKVAVDPDAAFAAMEDAVNANGNYWLLHSIGEDNSSDYTLVLQSKENYRAYVVNATFNDGSIAVDWNNAEEKAFAVVDSDAPDSHADLPGTEDLIKVNGEFSAKVASFEEAMPGLNEELESLREYKATIENQKFNEARTELLSRFTDIANTEEYEKLLEKMDEFDLETLEEKLYAVRGKTMRKETFSTHQAVGVRLGVGATAKANDDPYGSLFKKYKVEEE